MKTVFTIAILSAVTSAFGCATDPNKQVKDTDSAHVADVRSENAEESTLDAAQVKDHAQLDAAHQKQDGSLEKKVSDEEAKYDKDRNAAEANVVEARRTFRAEALARFEKLQVRITALDSSKASKASVTTLHNTAATVKTAMVNLDAVADASWFVNKQRIETNLTALEKDIHDTEARL